MIPFQKAITMLLLTENITLTNGKIRSILHDAEKTAAAVHLLYVSDTQPGITRVRKKNTFIYMLGNRQVKDAATLRRIKSLVIPPAWENVWICSSENGHLQATGTDVKKRKQYKYHPLWNAMRNHTKFYRLHSFGSILPSVRKKLDHDLSLPGMPPEKVLAAVVSLMEKTSIRVGNNMYEKLYGSYGLTTLKDKHVTFSGSSMQFIFRGKKGVRQDISIKSKRLTKIIRQCQDIPGQELFQYYDEQGNHRAIDSGMVNNYLKSISGENFTAKDFRTWSGTVHALVAFREIGESDTITQTKRNIVSALDSVAAHLGNTRTVCRKYYVHPAIIRLYERNHLGKYLTGSAADTGCEKYGLDCEEKILMHILEKEKLAV